MKTFIKSKYKKILFSSPKFKLVINNIFDNIIYIDLSLYICYDYNKISYILKHLFNLKKIYQKTINSLCNFYINK